MRRRIRLCAGVPVLAAALGLTGCGGASKAPPGTTQPAPRTPHELVGVMFNGPVVAGNINVDQQVKLAVQSGVESLRVSINWAAVQPYRSFAEVPPAARSQFTDLGGVPTRFGQLDQLLGAAAAHGLSLLPVIENAPVWDRLQPGNAASPPRSLQPFAAFMTGLVRRYGPGGTYWSGHPGQRPTPIRMWQIWNEPHFADHWSVQPFASSYVALLSAAHAALKAADPGSQVVLAGLADFSWRYLAQIYRVPGAGRLFDVAAIHPYTAQPRGVITILQRARAVMNQFGDGGKPILATEITWPSSEGKAPPQFGVSTTEAQQAQRLSQVLPLLSQNRVRLGLEGFYWYTWMGDETPGRTPYAFDYAGLLKYVRGTVSAKPALAAFSQGAMAIEGCRPLSVPC